MSSFLLIFLCATAHAEPSVQIRTEIEPREIYIGDPVLVGVLVTVSTGVASTPLSPPQTMGDFELLNLSSPTASFGKDGKVTTTYRFIVTTYSTGPVILPALPLAFSTITGSHTEAKTEEITIKVKSLLEEKGDEGNIRPLKGLFDFKSYLWLWILLGILLAGTGGYFLRGWFSGRKGTTPVPIGPPRPPEEVAWEAIHALEDADLVANGQIKEFYYRLSVVLRQYMEHRYRISALDRTTHELLIEFRRQKFSMDLINLCRDFFDNADLVKFAKFTPDEPEVQLDLNRAKQFINTTTPQKPAAEKKDQIPV